MPKLGKLTEEWKKNKPLYKPVNSSRSDICRAPDVMKNGSKRLIHFGDASMSDFRQHKDPKRRKSYLDRSGGIRNKEGKLTKDDKNSANYYSRRYLW